MRSKQLLGIFVIIILIAYIGSAVYTMHKSEVNGLRSQIAQLERELDDARYGADRLIANMQYSFDAKDYTSVINNYKTLKNKYTSIDNGTKAKTLYDKAVIEDKKVRAEAERIRREQEKLITVAIRLISVECIGNDHVGNEWAYGCNINGTNIGNGQSITITTKLKDNIVIECTTEEIDTVPDIGSSKLTIDVSELKVNKSKNYSTNVIVTENRGRYSGHDAVWEFTFSIKRK